MCGNDDDNITRVTVALSGFFEKQKKKTNKREKNK